MAKAFQVDTGGTLTTNLRVYYKQEDLTEYYLGGGTYDQTGVGSPTFAAGKVSNALTLDGSSQYTTIPTGAMPHQQNMSIAFWFKFSSTVGGKYMGGETGGGKNMYIDYDNNAAGVLRWNKLTGGTNKACDYTWTDDTNPHLLILTHDSTNGMKMYFDGNTTPVATNTDTSAPEDPSAVWEWGSFSGLNSPLGGYIDEGGIWTKTLSTTEVTDLYNGGSGQTMVDVVASNNMFQGANF